MVNLFISYSHVDGFFVEDFIPSLREKYKNVWFDGEIKGGQLWWSEILKHINECDIFIYLLSNESIASNYCEDEYMEALRTRKKILPIQIRAKTVIPDDLSQYQIVDFSSGPKKQENWEKLYEAIEWLKTKIEPKSLPPLKPKPTPPPDQIRKSFIDTLTEKVPVHDASLYARATNKIFWGICDRSAAQIKSEMNLKPTDRLQDYLDDFVSIYVRLAEKLATEKLLQSESLTIDAAVEIVSIAAKQIGMQAKATSEILGRDLITGKTLSKF